MVSFWSFSPSKLFNVSQMKRNKLSLTSWNIILETFHLSWSQKEKLSKLFSFFDEFHFLSEKFPVKSVKWCRTLSFTWYTFYDNYCRLLTQHFPKFPRQRYAWREFIWCCNSSNRNESDIYCVSLFNLMKPDGMQLGRCRWPVISNINVVTGKSINCQ